MVATSSNSNEALCPSSWAPCGSAEPLKGAIHRPKLNSGQPQNICGGVQRTSWRRLVCGKINHSVRPVPSSAPVLAPCLWETQTPFIQISPCTAQSWLSQLYCVSVPAFKGNNYSCILPSERMHSQELCGAIELCLYGLLLCSSVIHELPQSLTCLESISFNVCV